MSTYGWHLDIWTRVHQAVLDALDESGAGAPEIRLYTAGNTLLATIELSVGESEVDAEGNLILLPVDDTFTPAASGEAAYATIVDRSATVLRKLACVESSVAVSDAVALADLTLTELVPVTIISLVIAAGDTLD
jgi:hypothetical protein